MKTLKSIKQEIKLLATVCTHVMFIIYHNYNLTPLLLYL